jgi:hypothetical protein
MKLKTLVASIAMVGAISNANAFFLYPGVTLLEDDNIERLVKGERNTDPTKAGTLQVGDSLRGVLEFPNIKPLFGTGQLGISPELTGIFQTEIKAIIDANNDGLAEKIIWGTSSAFTTTYGAGAVVAMYTGGADLDVGSCASIAACEAAATDGSKWAVAGFADLDDEWVSYNSVLNWGAVTVTGPTTKVAAVNYALSILENNTGYTLKEQDIGLVECLTLFTCAGDGKTGLVGSGDVLGGQGLANGYGARSDIDARLSVVPEPASIALLGLGLAGLGFSSRRRPK